MKKLVLTTLMTFGIIVSMLASTPEVQAKLNELNSVVHLDAAQTPKVEVIITNFMSRVSELKTKVSGDQLKKAKQIESKAFQDKLMSILTDAQKKLYLAYISGK